MWAIWTRRRTRSDAGDFSQPSSFHLWMVFIIPWPSMGLVILLSHAFDLGKWMYIIPSVHLLHTHTHTLDGHFTARGRDRDGQTTGGCVYGHCLNTNDDLFKQSRWFVVNAYLPSSFSEPNLDTHHELSISIISDLPWLDLLFYTPSQYMYVFTPTQYVSKKGVKALAYYYLRVSR